MSISAHQINGSEIAAAAVGKDVATAPVRLKFLLQKQPNGLAVDDPLDSADQQIPPGGARETQSVGQYLFGSPYTDPTDTEAGQGNWTSYTSSRIYIRLFSRGLMGATLYTLANRWIPGQLKGYQAIGEFDRTKPLQYLSRGFDIVYGKPIQAYVKQYYKLSGKSLEEASALAEAATTFRTKRDFSLLEDGSQMGRSLGAEIVGMTTDFAAGSVGDATGRQIAIMFDPNIRKSWEDKEDGRIHWKEFAKACGHSAWQIFSKNQGEDWAAALPYVYQMRYQRVALDKLYRGFGISSDHQFNGGSWRLSKQGDIVDSYAKAGAMDLQGRFTGYNVYTLMYREMYDNLAERIKHYRDEGSLRLPSDSTDHNVITAAAHMFRYVAKSTIKATIYMTPAVPFFWMTRTPQSKSHGMGIIVDSQTGAVYDRPIKASFDPFSHKNTRGVFDRALSPFGKACHETSKALNKGLEAVHAPDFVKHMGWGELKTAYNYTKPTFAETWVNSSASYTPYMIAKAETALRWDREKDAQGLNEMDRAIYRALDGVARMNLGEVKAGLLDIREEIVRPPSNRQIENKRTRQLSLREQANQEPETKVSDVQDETQQERTEATVKDASWQARNLKEQFTKETSVPQGVTIH